MATGIDSINLAFAANVNLRKRIFDAINETPQHTLLFQDIANFHLASRQSSIANGSKDTLVEQPPKKRKLEDGVALVETLQSDKPRTVILEARDLSFTLPQRKKLHLSIVQYGQDFNDPNTSFSICVRNPATSQVEFEYPIKSFAYALRVPVPEKAQKQYNFCLLPPTQAQPSSSSLASGEGVIWSVSHGPLKSCQIHSDVLAKIATGPENILEDALNAVLQHGGNRLVYPADAEFVSSMVEAHRKGDKMYHIKAFRGSKDGYLFLLETGIFFGFKKPLAFFPFHEIESVSYTAVLQRTFNLIIVVQSVADAAEQELEFSMLDQADFAGIDAYIKKHQLQDSSMAEARRAKQFKVNGAKGSAPESGEDDGRTELERAEQEMEDEEDELEEDYNPDSDDGSDDSGTSDDEDEYEDSRIDTSRDLVKDELGSEAEDVEIEDEDEDEDEEADEADDTIPEEAIGTSKTKVAAAAAPPPLPHMIRSQPGAPDLDDEDQL